MKRKAFTLIELVVAVGLMSMIIVFTSVIFRTAIDGYRVAVANGEIMQKARAITEQLNSDLRGLQKGAPLFIWFEKTRNDPDRVDQMMFFAAGDFSSSQLYTRQQSVSGYTIPDDAFVLRGNLARVQYGHSQDINNVNSFTLDDLDMVLARRCHIMKAPFVWPYPGADSDPCTAVDWPLDLDDIGREYDQWDDNLRANDSREYDGIPLSIYKKANIEQFEDIINACIERRPVVDYGEPNSLHQLMCQGVSNFTIQFAYWDITNFTGNDLWELNWFPGTDPDRNTATSDSHFDQSGQSLDEFGVFFNVKYDSSRNPLGNAPGDRPQYWFENEELEYNNDNDKLRADFYPAALKFTFTVYDSKGFIKGGRNFTHIVYLNQ